MATMAPPVTKGLNFTCQGLPSPNSMKGSSMPRPGLVLSAMAASGQPLFCFGFWSRACAARRRAGPRAAAQRGGAGAAGAGGRATSGTRLSWRPVPFWRQAPVTSGCENGGNAQRPHSFGPARAEARRRARARDACRPRDSAEPSQTRPRGHPRSRGDRAGAGPSARRSVRCPAVAGRAPGSVATMSVSPPRSLKKRSRANPSAPTSKRKHANRRPTPCVSNPAAPRPQPREKPAAPNTTDKPERRRAPPQLPNKSPRRR